MRFTSLQSPSGQYNVIFRGHGLQPELNMNRFLSSNETILELSANAHMGNCYRLDLHRDVLTRASLEVQIFSLDGTKTAIVWIEVEPVSNGLVRTFKALKNSKDRMMAKPDWIIIVRGHVPGGRLEIPVYGTKKEYRVILQADGWLHFEDLGSCASHGKVLITPFAGNAVSTSYENGYISTQNVNVPVLDAQPGLPSMSDAASIGPAPAYGKDG
jgi:hypothetical protein